jgi:hypothetical protein
VWLGALFEIRVLQGFSTTHITNPTLSQREKPLKVFPKYLHAANTPTAF